MEIKEAIEITQNEKECNYWVNSKEYQALQKLISIAEQVERAEGIKDIPPQKLSSGELWLPMWAKTHNGLNAQWRALIAGRLEKVGEEIDKIMPCSCHEAYKSRRLSAPDCPNCNFKDDLTETIRALFLGENLKGESQGGG